MATVSSSLCTDWLAAWNTSSCSGPASCSSSSCEWAWAGRGGGARGGGSWYWRHLACRSSSRLVLCGSSEAVSRVNSDTDNPSMNPIPAYRFILIDIKNI